MSVGRWEWMDELLGNPLTSASILAAAGDGVEPGVVGKWGLGMPLSRVHVDISDLGVVPVEGR